MDISVQLETDVGFANITDIGAVVADYENKTLELFSDGRCCLTVEYVDSKSLEKVYGEIFTLLKKHKSRVRIIGK